MELPSFLLSAPALFEVVGAFFYARKVVRKKKSKITPPPKKREEFTDYDHRHTIGLKNCLEEAGRSIRRPSGAEQRLFNSKLQGVEDATRLLEESDGADD